MTEIWDTMLAGRVQPAGTRYDAALDQAAHGDRVCVASVSLAEITHGLRRAIDRHPQTAQQLAWFRSAARDRLIEVISLDGSAAALAGEVRAIRPLPPTGPRRRDGTRPEARLAWFADILIACTAWSSGRAIRTENVIDFEAIRAAIALAAPAALPLEVVPDVE